MAAAYDAAKAETPALTQEALMGELGVSQGLFPQWCKGTTAIPDKHLIWLGGQLGFDPFELRPSLAAYLLPGATKKGRGATIARFLKYAGSATDSEFQRFSAVLEAFAGDPDNHPEAR